MKLIQLAILTAITCFCTSIMANEITITNSSDHAIPVTYQIAYHNFGQPVVLKDTAAVTVNGNNKVTVVFSQNHYDYAGIIILAVRKDSTDKQWHLLPESLRQFDKDPGCWVKTDAQQPLGNLVLTYYKDFGNGHGHITCNT